MTRPGGNFTHPDHNWATGQVVYHVYVAWHRQPETYETAMEAEQALREALNPSAVPFRPRRQGEAA